MKSRSVLAAILFVGCLIGLALAFSAPVAGSSADLEIEHVLSQSSSEGKIDVETRFSVPDSTVELEIGIPEETDVYEAHGFNRIDDRTYEWTGTVTEPFLRYEYEGTVYGTRGDRDGYLFVATEEWALVRTPSIDVSGSTTDPDSQISRKNSVDGEGVASTHMAYLGPHTEYTGSAAGQAFRLIVPDAAELREDPEAIIATFEATVERLRIGEHAPDVFVVAAPTAEHTWAPAGLQRGNGGDMWVRDVEPLGTNRDTWIHEYVHTRQGYEPTAETRWTIEGMADYYSALLPYETGEIDYETFVDRLEEGTASEYDDVVLADPATWTGTDADYDRGTLVFAHLDRQMRAHAGTTLDAVIAEIHTDDSPLTQARFLDAIESAGGTELRAVAEEYTETSATPPIPTQSEHVEAFGGPDVRYSIESWSVSGPYRAGALAEPRIVTEETLEANVTISNVGADSGAYGAEFRVDDETVTIASGRLDPGEITTHRFTHQFDSPGTFDLSVGSERQSVLVEEPADVIVTALDIDPAEPRSSEAVTLRATVESAANRPASGEVVFSVDSEQIAIETVRIGEGETTIETTTQFGEAGEYTVSAGDRSETVIVSETTTTGDESPSRIEEQRGFTALVAAFALVGFILLTRRK